MYIGNDLEVGNMFHLKMLKKTFYVTGFYGKKYKNAYGGCFRSVTFKFHPLSQRQEGILCTFDFSLLIINLFVVVNIVLGLML